MHVFTFNIDFVVKCGKRREFVISITQAVVLFIYFVLIHFFFFWFININFGDFYGDAAVLFE